MKNFINRAWNSPTGMTWMSYSTKALTLFAVLPLVLRKFSPGDIVLWYLFSTIIALQAIADFGFRVTFSRLISYAYSGAADIGLFHAGVSTPEHSQEVNLPLISKILSAMKKIYGWLTVAVFIILLVFGTWSLLRPVKDTSNIPQSWISWAIVLVVSCAGFYGKIFLNFLEGINKIALVRRVETFTSLGSIFTSIAVLIFAPTLLNLVIANQVWVLAVVFRDAWLCRKTEAGLYLRISKPVPVERSFLMKIWQPAWRSGISGLMSTGLTNLTGLIYAQMGNAPEVAAYLLALRLLNQIRDVSMAPFYSKISVLAGLRVHQRMDELKSIIQRGMFISHLVYTIAFILTGILIDPVLHWIHSTVPFVSQPLWILLGIAFFVHRFGAMHIQVYLSTNHIISHIADGISGFIFIVSALILVPFIHLYAIPVAMLAGYLGFYSWYAASHSYRSLLVSAWDFERKASLFPMSLFIIYILFTWIRMKMQS